MPRDEFPQGDQEPRSHAAIPLPACGSKVLSLATVRATRYNIDSMYITLCKSKIHRATVTQADLHYVGSITIAEDIMEAADIVAHERVQVLNVRDGARLETYVISGERGSGVICLNGPAAHFFVPGDVCIIVAYITMTPAEAKQWQPTIVFVDEQNRPTRCEEGEMPFTTSDDY